MKIRPTSTHQQIFENYQHPPYEFNEDESSKAKLIKPKPATKEAIQKAQFIDKSFDWRTNARI